MSLCDTCREPGRCCRVFILNGGDFARGLTRLEAMAALADHDDGGDPAPFEPLFRNSLGVWWFWCPRLTRDGRCGDYEHRPNVCRDFEPASEPLCIYFRPLAEKCDGCTPFFKTVAITPRANEVSCLPD